MGCPGCGSSLWNGEQCPACGRLATDTSRRYGDHPLPAAAARGAVAAGAVGGALAGYLGGGPFNLGQFGNQVLLVATLGGAIGLIGVLAIWIVVRDRDWMHWWLVPALAGSAALTLGIQQLIDWGLGWAAAQAGKGLIAAAIGSVIGGVLSAAGAYVLAWRRESRRSKSAARAPQGSIR